MVNLVPTILASCMIGMVIFALFDVSQRPAEKQNRALSVLLLLLLINASGELFLQSGAYVYAPALAGAELPFKVLLGPALYFYAHATMSSERVINKRLLALMLSGPILIIAAMAPFIFTLTSAEKLALADPATRDPELFKVALFMCFSTTVVFILFTSLFLVITFRLHKIHRQQIMERFSDIEQRSVGWLSSVLIIWGAVWLLYAIEFILGAIGWRWFGSGKLLPVIELIALIIFIQKALSQKVLKPSDKAAPNVSKARTALLSTERMQMIALKLDNSMQKDKLFLQNDLSLKKLSESTSESENHISETLSQLLQTNFFQFINNFRVEEAKRELLDKSKLVTNIALDVGFNSKSTFNTAFKKVAGCSPSAYRSLILDSEKSPL